MAQHRHNSDYYIKAAEKHDLRVEAGRGSHTKIYGHAGRGYTVVPKGKDLSPGVENQIRKWFAQLGILLTLAIAFAYGVYVNLPVIQAFLAGQPISIGW